MLKADNTGLSREVLHSNRDSVGLLAGGKWNWGESTRQGVCAAAARTREV